MKKNNFANKKCIPCHGGMLPLKREQLEPLLKQLSKGWLVIENHHLEKDYKLSSFREVLKLVNMIGELAEKEGHHPDIFLSYDKLKIKLWTHKINGISESDIILAAKIDDISK